MSFLYFSHINIAIKNMNVFISTVISALLIFIIPINAKPFINLSIEPNFHSHQVITKRIDIPNSEWEYYGWINEFGLSFGINPGFSLFNSYNIGLVLDNYISAKNGNPGLKMQTYLGLGALYAFWRIRPFYFSADLGYVFYYYVIDNTLNSYYKSDGFGYSISLGRKISSRFSIAMHFYNSYLHRLNPSIDCGSNVYCTSYGREDVVIQNIILGISFIYILQKHTHDSK